MPRTLRIQVAFEPNRLSHEHLRHVYEELVPITSRRVPRGAEKGTATHPLCEGTLRENAQQTK